MPLFDRTFLNGDAIDYFVWSESTMMYVTNQLRYLVAPQDVRDYVKSHVKTKLAKNQKFIFADRDFEAKGLHKRGIYVLNGEGIVEDRRFKSILVPLGEYYPIPFSNTLQKTKLGRKMMKKFQTFFPWESIQPGGKSHTVFKDSFNVKALICYEGLFENDFSDAYPEWILVSSNDEDFKELKLTIFEITSWLSIEAGAPLVRVSNDGYNAHVSYKGEVLESSHSSTYPSKFLDVTISPADTKSFYARYGQLTWLSLVALFWMLLGVAA
jgi:apolipoprotein N-acyltransferase